MVDAAEVELREKSMDYAAAAWLAIIQASLSA